MLKFTVAVFFVSLASQGICRPQQPTGELARLAANGNFEEASNLLKKYYENQIKSFAPKSGFGNGIPAPAHPQLNAALQNRNGEYFYQSEASYHSVVNNNGKVKEEHDGLGVIDNNGAVTYYKPTSVV